MNQQVEVGEGRRRLSSSEWGGWLHSFVWDQWVGLTTGGDTPFSTTSFARAFDKYVTALVAKLPAPASAISWFRAIETAPRPDGRRHLHALLYGTASLSIRQLRDAWPHGHTYAKLFDPARGAAWYCAGMLEQCDDYDVSRSLPPARNANGGEPETPRHLASDASLLHEIVAKWEARRCDAELLESTAPIATMCVEIIADLRRVRHGDAHGVSVRHAAAVSGYSEAHLRRLIARNVIPNLGRKGKPLLRASDVPKKPGHVLQADVNAARVERPHPPTTDALRRRRDGEV
jgi:hypothetical protein